MSSGLSPKWCALFSDSCSCIAASSHRFHEKILESSGTPKALFGQFSMVKVSKYIKSYAMLHLFFLLKGQRVSKKLKSVSFLSFLLSHSKMLAAGVQEVHCALVVGFCNQSQIGGKT